MVIEGLGCFGVKPLFQGRKRGAYMDVFTAFLRKMTQFLIPSSGYIVWLNDKNP